MEHVCTVNIQATSREDYRRQLITLFLDEEHGSRTSVSEYKYNVDTLSDGTVIYLKRPTALNKGVDFEVRVEGINFRYGKYGNVISTGNRPSHMDLYKDLENKQKEGNPSFSSLKTILDKIYNCETVSMEEYNGFSFSTGYSIELIMTTLKWLFIEQDITYWNRSGREMLYLSLCEMW